MIPTDEQLATWVGPKWETVYRRKFERFRADPRPGFRPSWNWWAALFPAWFLAHRLYAAFVVPLLAVMVVAFLLVWTDYQQPPEDLLVGVVIGGTFAYVALYPLAVAFLVYTAIQFPDAEHIGLAAVALALTVVHGVIADWLLYQKALGAAGALVVSPPAAGETVKVKRRRPPSVSQLSTGLIAALVIVGMLGAVFILVTPMCACGEGKAYVAEMKSDLRNLTTAEESYFADSVAYTRSLRSMASGPTDTAWTPSTGVTITIGEANGTGWSATAKHNATSVTCAIYVGSATPPLAGLLEGDPKCSNTTPAPAPH